MKRIFLTVITVVGIAAALLTGAGTAAAGKIFDLRVLKGECRAVLSEVRYESVEGSTGPVVSYCSGYGTVTFDGMGTGTIQEGPMRCIVPGMDPVTTINTGSFTYTYTVSPDGTVLITEPRTNIVSHCRLADNGKTLMCDATGRDPNILLWQYIFVKK